MFKKTRDKTRKSKEQNMVHTKDKSVITNDEANRLVRETLIQKPIFFRPYINYIGDTNVISKSQLRKMPYENRYQNDVLFLGCGEESSVSRYVEESEIDHIELRFESRSPNVCCYDKDVIKIYRWVKEPLSKIDITLMVPAPSVRHEFVYHMDLDTKKMAIDTYEQKKAKDINFRKKQDKFYAVFDNISSIFVGIGKMIHKKAR